MLISLTLGTISHSHHLSAISYQYYWPKADS